MNEPNFETYCRHPFHLKGKEVYIHPEDVLAFRHNPVFISVIYFGVRERIKNMQLGRLWGYDVMLQDDMQILLHAIMKNKRVRK